MFAVPFLAFPRQLFESPRWVECRPFDQARAWLDVIFLARYKAGEDPVSGLWLSRGEVACSFRWLADRWGWARTTVQDWFGRMVESGDLKQVKKADPAARVPAVYLLVNYEVWNGPGDEPGQGAGQGDRPGGDTPQDAPSQQDAPPEKEQPGQGVRPVPSQGICIARDSVGSKVVVSKGAPVEMTPTFLAAWADYPKRPNNSRMAAWRQWRARMKEGVEESEMHEGVKAYATHCQRAGKLGTEYVKMGQTFFGRDLHFRAALETAAEPSPSIYDAEGYLTPEAIAIMGRDM